MTVKAIIAKKGNDVVTVAEDLSLLEAARVLAAKGIGAVIIVAPDGAMAGIASERDFVRAFAEQGALNGPVREIMTRKVETCSLSDTIVAVMERMTRGKFRHLPVLEQSRLAGIISIGDVVKFRLQEMEHEQEALREYILTA